MVDTPALGAGASGREGSSPFSRTKENRDRLVSIFFSTVRTRTFTKFAESKFEVKGREVNGAKKCLHFFAIERRSGDLPRMSNRRDSPG